MNFVLKFLHENRRRLNLSAYGAGDELTSVLLTPRFRASSHVVYLVLPQGRSEPVLVAKVPRLRDGGESLRREADNLRFARGVLQQRSSSIPQLVAFEDYCGRPILVETALVGRPMDPPFVRRKLAYCCEAAWNWLADLQPAPIPNNSDARSVFDRLIAAPLDYLADVVAWNDAERQRLEQTRRLLEPLRDIPVPTVLEHGDFSHPNLMLLADGSAGVVDWEMAEPYGLSSQDLVFFLTYAAFARHQCRENGQYMPAIRAAFFGESAWAIPYLLSYADRMQVPPEAVTPLFLLCWIRYLAGLLRRLDESATEFGTDTISWLRQNRYYHAWMYAVDHIDQLCCQGALR